MKVKTRYLSTMTACLALSFVLGSVHAFSIFLSPIEQTLGVTRASASLTYSLALIALTVMVTIGPRVYHLLPAWGVAATATILAAAGAALAGTAGSIWVLWLGYGILFGAANGLGYGYALQLSAHASPSREGLAMGLVTAAYAMGATVFPLIFSWALKDGMGFAFQVLSLTIAGVGAVVVALLVISGDRFPKVERGAGSETLPLRAISLLWISYGCAVLAGLMAIGHATGIAATNGVSVAGLVAAPVAIAVANMFGSIGGGVAVDRFQARYVLAALALFTATALLSIAIGFLPVLPALAIVGMAYGATIAAFPAMLARRWGVARGARIYGLVFTAWGGAGLIGPVGAGTLFDMRGTYTMAILLAALLAIGSAVAFASLGRALRDL